MNHILKKLETALLALAVLGANAAWAVNDLPGGPAVRQLNLHPPVTKIAEEQVWLHWFMLIICTVIFVAVFGVMFYSIWKHRKSVGHKSANFHESVKVEIAWTVVPFIIVILMALPATKAVVASKDTSNAELTIKATGYQWKWGYDYIKGEGEGIGFISTLDNAQREMSVIHSFAVNSFGIKQDAIPGFVRDTWFRAEKTGDFHGQCQELCGKEHAYMPIHVKVVSAEDYTAWVAAETKKMAAKQDDPNKVWTLAELTQKGEKVYAANCAACHQPNGKGAGPIKPLDGAAVVLDADANKQIKVLLNGQNNAMPAWKQLSDTEIAAVISFTKNNWSNKTGQSVQPADVRAAR